MIAAGSASKQVQSNINGASYAAGIDDENMAHIIGLFTDLYSDRELAVIREYSTNARDAQIEAGYDGPIEVDLPSPLSPFFRVKDRGIGLSHDDIRTIYSRYGTSTKRATNDQNGMLGLGCKSALTYSDQFTVESVKDGTKMVCSISRDGYSVPVMTVVDTRATDEPNGTTVIVPARRNNDFESKAASFFSYWKPGTVLVNGQPPKQLEGLRLTDDLFIVEDQDPDTRLANNSDKVVMGGVAYPHNFDVRTPYGHSIVAYVPIGAVEFAPSREALSYSQHTNKALEGVAEKVYGAIHHAIQREVEKASTPQEAVKTALRWRAVANMGSTGSYRSNSLASYRYKGRSMPDGIAGSYEIAARNSHKLSATTQAPRSLALEIAADCIFVTGYDVATFTATHKRKLLQYAQDKGINPAHFALCGPAPTDRTWIKDEQIHKWEDVKAVKLPKNAPTSTYGGRPTGSYDARMDGKSVHVQAADIDTSNPIFYGPSLNKYQLGPYADALTKYVGDCTVVAMPANRQAKFERNFPKAKTIDAGLREAYSKFLDGLDYEVKVRVAIYDAGIETALKRLPLDKIEDDDVKVAARIAATVDPSAALQAREGLYRLLRARSKDSFEWSNPLDRYPLVTNIDVYTLKDEPEHVALYMNTVYDSLSES